MSSTEVIFYVLGGLTALAGIGVVTFRSVVHAALALIVTLLGVAATFLLLSVEFLFLAQLLIYGGAVTVLLLFALMLTRVRDVPALMVGAQWPLALLAAGSFLGIFAFSIFDTEWRGDTENLTPIPFADIGDTLFRVWAVPFEIASLVLLVALVGAIVLGRQEEGDA
ncbi:MAG: NADH-quinone oxidoreductase subunit J [Dehalococcoidia bacterium]|nr:NADH-quinone oxidoreductase subunit J [Dehalococcoidia bacterium]